jgi:hypothetical protein
MKRTRSGYGDEHSRGYVDPKRCLGVYNMTHPHPGRRFLVSALLLAPFASLARSRAANAQAAPASSPIVQPNEKTKAGFLARARALRDQAVREGDQAYGAVVVRDGVIVGEGRNTLSWTPIRRPMPGYWPSAMQLGGSSRAISLTATYTRRPRRVRCAKAPSIGHATAGITMIRRPRRASLRN